MARTAARRAPARPDGDTEYTMSFPHDRILIDFLHALLAAWLVEFLKATYRRFR